MEVDKKTVDRAKHREPFQVRGVLDYVQSCFTFPYDYQSEAVTVKLSTEAVLP